MKTTAIRLTVLLFLAGCSSGQRTWVAIGDSITYLNDHADETDNRVSKGYMSRVAEQLPDIKYVNKGFNGWTAAQVAEKIDDLGLDRADIYSVFLGTNDWWHGNLLGTLEDYKSNSGQKTFFGSLRMIIDKLRTLNSEAVIVLITPMQRVDFVSMGDMKNNAWGSYRQKNDQSLSAFADAVLQVADYEKLKAVDLYHKSGMTHENLVRYKRLRDPKTGDYKNFPYPGFIDIPFNPETDEYPYPADAIGMTYDGLHPSDSGNDVIAKMLVQQMK